MSDLLAEWFAAGKVSPHHTRSVLTPRTQALNLALGSIVICEVSETSSPASSRGSSFLVPRLRLGTHRLGGSASLSALPFHSFFRFCFPPFATERQAEPAVQFVPRRSLGTRLPPVHTHLDDTRLSRIATGAGISPMQRIIEITSRCRNRQLSRSTSAKAGCEKTGSHATIVLVMKWG